MDAYELRDLLSKLGKDIKLDLVFFGFTSRGVGALAFSVNTYSFILSL